MRASRGTSRLTPILLLCVLGVGLPQGLAHALEAWAYGIEDKIVVEVAFSDGAPALGVAVHVSGEDGRLLAEGDADDQGRFLFMLSDVPSQLKLVAEDNLGHRCERTMTRNELAGPARPSLRRLTAVRSAGLSDVRVAQIRMDVSLRNLEREVAGLKRARNGVSTEKVFAGLGLIFGLTGAVTYVLARGSKSR